MFCTIFSPLSVAKVLGKHVRSSSYLLVFFKENSHSRGKLTEGLFLLQLLYTKFFEKLTLINSEANLQPPQHLKSSFFWH